MDIFQVILATLVSEFSDLTDVEQAVRVALRLMLAALLGGLLGFEREAHGKAAGIRTHMLVCSGAALFVLGSEMVEGGDDAMSRVVQGIVDRKSTRLNSSHVRISYAVFCLKKKKTQ